MTTTMVAVARRLAERAHKGQTYGDGNYTRHLERVVGNLQRMGYTQDNILIVGWLHDVVEDTAISLETVGKKFGYEVAEAVDAISRRKFTNGLATVPPVAEKESEKDYLARVCANPLAAKVKWADMCDNLLMCRSVASPEHKRRLHGKYLNALKVLAEVIE